jgi:hypothetical protein
LRAMCTQMVKSTDEKEKIASPIFFRVAATEFSCTPSYYKIWYGV